MKTTRRTKVHMSRSLGETAGDILDDYPPEVREFWDGGFRHYVNDVILEARDAGSGLSFAEAVQQGKTRYERAVAEGRAQPPMTTAQLIEKMRHEPQHAPVVYYMRLGEFVKIGTTVNIRARYDAIHPQGVMAVEHGSYELEHQRHRQFVELHSHGEWFTLAPVLAEHIIAVRESFRSEDGKGTDEWLSPRLPATKNSIRP